jgi:site-specific DNA-methyltransferase (adenine-specific)
MTPPQPLPRDVVTVHHGEALDILRAMPDESVDAVVTDPPYGLAEHSRQKVEKALLAWLTGDREHVPDGPGGFMNRDWDGFVPPPAIWDECFRVLKPGGHLLAFAGSRTVDLMGVSIRLAGLVTDGAVTGPGFAIRDGIAWVSAEGFPKGIDVSKAIDKAAGAEREVVGTKVGLPGYSLTNGSGDHRTFGRGMGNTGNGEAECAITAPATPGAAHWQGWNTSLKPAQEPIIVARKPLQGTVAQNVLTHGTGALNIDGCRVGSNGGARRATFDDVASNSVYGAGLGQASFAERQTRPSTCSRRSGSPRD